MQNITLLFKITIAETDSNFHFEILDTEKIKVAIFLRIHKSFKVNSKTIKIGGENSSSCLL